MATGHRYNYHGNGTKVLTIPITRTNKPLLFSISSIQVTEGSNTRLHINVWDNVVRDVFSNSLCEKHSTTTIFNRREVTCDVRR